MVAAASAWAAVRARTVTASAMPKEKLRPPWPLQARPEVARPRAGWLAVRRKVPSGETGCREGYCPSRKGRGRRSHATYLILKGRDIRHQPATQRCSGSQMKRDIAAIVDEGACYIAPLDHCGENPIGDSAGDRGHWRDETICERHARRMHRACDLSAWWARRQCGAQQRQFSTKIIQHGSEKLRGLIVRRPHLVRFPPRPAQAIDGPVLQVQASVGQQGGHCTHRTGNSVPVGNVTDRGRYARTTSSMRRTRPTCPPRRE